MKYLKNINKKSILIGVAVWLPIIAIFSFWGISAYADDKIIDCGDAILAIQWQTEPQRIEIESGNKYGQILNDMIEMRYIKGSHDTADEYRKMFGWGFFPPQNIRNIESEFNQYISTK